jgi:hypothetical protein
MVMIQQLLANPLCYTAEIDNIEEISYYLQDYGFLRVIPKKVKRKFRIIQ